MCPFCPHDNCAEGCRHRITVPAGVDLYREGELATRAYWLEEGYAAVSKYDQHGALRIANIARPGEFLGVDSLERESLYQATVTTLLPTSFCAIPRIQIIDSLDGNPMLLNRLLHGLCGRLLSAEYYLTNSDRLHSGHSSH